MAYGVVSLQLSESISIEDVFQVQSGSIEWSNVGLKHCWIKFGEDMLVPKVLCGLM